MDSNDELKETDIRNRTCCYFDAKTKTEDFNLDNILIKKKRYKNILVYNISYKTLIDAKPLRSGVDKIDGFIRVYDGNKYLILYEKHDFIFNKIRYLIRVKRGITYVVSHNYAKIKADSYDSLPLEKAMTFYNVLILIKSVFNKGKNKYNCGKHLNIT